MSVKFNQIIDNSRLDYFEQWAETSKSYKDEKLYEFLSSNLIFGDSLEIGCGAGYSTLEIIKKSTSVISIDENPFCIESVSEILQNENINFTKLLRGTIKFDNDYFNYEKKYDKINQDKINNLIIEGDILVDDNLIDFLKKRAFSNIVCWLMGGFKYILNERNQVNKGRSGIDGEREGYMYAHYKSDVYEKLAKLGNILLQKNGLLHIADRIQYKDINLVDKDQIVDLYISIFKQYNYTLSSNIKFFETKTESKIKLYTNQKIPEYQKHGVFLLSLKLA